MGRVTEDLVAIAQIAALGLELVGEEIADRLDLSDEEMKRISRVISEDVLGYDHFIEEEV